MNAAAAAAVILLAVTPVTYGANPDQNYTPAPAGRAWVALIHGGSWQNGEKAQEDATAAKFQAAGFATFNIEYRRSLGNAAVQWPAQQDDVVAALASIRAHAADYGIDPARGALYGFSAGGHIAVSAAVNETAATDVRAVVTVGGALQPDRDVNALFAGTADTIHATIGMTAVATIGCGNPQMVTCAARWRTFRPSLTVHPGSPPMFLVQGDADRYVYPVTAQSFAYFARRAGVQVTVVEVAGGGHNDGLLTGDPARWNTMIDWLREKTA